MKYNIGDKVKVKSLEWYNNNTSNANFICCANFIPFTQSMSIFCGCVMTIKSIDRDNVYYVEENHYVWTEDMFEGLADYNGNKENMDYIEITLNDKNYIIDVKKAIELGVVKETYTRCKSWEEFRNKYRNKQGCYYDEYTMRVELTKDPIITAEQLTENEAIALMAFSKLLKLRRDWIGDWNPDWSNGNVRKYYIEVRKNEFYIDYHYVNSRTFSFPTKEMAIEFLECFRNLFDQCKMLI